MAHSKKPKDDMLIPQHKRMAMGLPIPQGSDKKKGKKK